MAMAHWGHRTLSRTWRPSNSNAELNLSKLHFNICAAPCAKNAPAWKRPNPVGWFQHCVLQYKSFPVRQQVWQQRKQHPIQSSSLRQSNTYETLEMIGLIGCHMLALHLATKDSRVTEPHLFSALANTIRWRERHRRRHSRPSSPSSRRNVFASVTSCNVKRTSVTGHCQVGSGPKLCRARHLA